MRENGVNARRQVNTTQHQHHQSTRPVTSTTSRPQAPPNGHHHHHNNHQSQHQIDSRSLQRPRGAPPQRAEQRSTYSLPRVKVILKVTLKVTLKVKVTAIFFFFFFWGRVDENEARSVAQDGSESSSTSDTTPATSFSLHATTDPSSLRSPVAVCVLALGVTCSNGGNSNGKLDAQHSTAQHSGEIGGELTIQRPDSTAVMSLVYLALSSLTTPTTNPSASATVSRSGKDSALHRAL
ncbi:uncharacterized protein LOC123502510 [Portunus trituberculatus]|uniref:uncharacterized protein LOC123502510 n=1 Tax=Portunus trituberculatus TaxID=210409 RepID=UPI001E1CCF9B|nr:uncharacterized protein LOC123502510 [Portunus trituberculatus]